MATYAQWQAAVLKALGAPITRENVRALNAWQRAEGGSAAYNPLNTTQYAPGATSYNRVGVRNFTSPQQGTQATVRTLENGRYGNIVGLLRSGRANAMQVAQAVEHSPWGTGGGVVRVLGGNVSSGLTPGQAPAAPHAPTMQPQGLDKAALATMLIQSIGQRIHHGHSDMTGLLSGVQGLQQQAQTLVPSQTYGETFHSPEDHPAHPQKVGSIVFPVAGPHQFTDTWGAARPDIPGGHHQGTDIFAPKGTPVVAVTEGTITKMGPSQIGGNRIWINGQWYYAHLSRFASGMKPGARVHAGQVIGYVGNTGDARGTPPHLHFGWSPNGDQGASWANPYGVLRGRQSH